MGGSFRGMESQLAAEFAELLDWVAVKRSLACQHQPLPTVHIDGEYLCRRCWCWVSPDEWEDDDEDEEVDPDG